MVKSVLYVNLRFHHNLVKRYAIDFLTQAFVKYLLLDVGHNAKESDQGLQCYENHN